MIRDDVQIERVDGTEPGRGKGGGPKTPNKRARREIDVSGIDFPAPRSTTSSKLQRRLAEAAVAFENERFPEAEKLLASIEQLSPGVPEVMELRGLTFYRLGRWKKAIAELERFSDATGSVEQHPVMADCHRALRHWTRAEELWEELGEASPSAELVEEGRIVHAGTLADRGRIPDAIRFLERAPKAPRRPGLHHLRRWYALADLYERSGDLARARRVFGDIVAAEPTFGDAAERMTLLQ